MEVIKILIFFSLGAILGSFLNSLVYRIYNHLSLWERSLCPKCQQKLVVRDLVPLLSFIFLKTKCRFCQERINWQYFFVELITGILFALFFIKYGTLNLFLIRDLFFILILIFIFIFDLKYYLILNKAVLPAMIVSSLFNLYLGFDWKNLLLGGVIGSIFFFLQYLPAKGAWLGAGDVKLGALIGVMLGWELTLLTIVLAYLIGGLTAFILLISKKKKFSDVLPMGVFLSAGAIIVLICGERILDLGFKIL